MKTLKFSAFFVSIFVLFISFPVIAENNSSDQLLRLSYSSAATGKNREYFVYLPVGYNSDKKKNWPVMLFLHGHGQRGNGLKDLDYVLTHGPLMEAWIQRKELPFIIISPQLPVKFGIPSVEEDHSADPIPVRLKEGVPERNYAFKSPIPINRQNSEDFPEGPHSQFKGYPDFDGWINIHEELLHMVDTVLKNYRTDSDRVYLTGISYGGYGTFHMAAKHPERWAAIAPIVGTGKIADAKKLAEARLPIWMFGGGKDRTVKPHWLYEMAAAL